MTVVTQHLAATADVRSTPGRLRVIVAGGALLLREGIARAHATGADTDVVAVAGEAVALRMAIERTRPDVIVNGEDQAEVIDERVDLAAKLAVECPTLGVVVVSDHVRMSQLAKLLATSPRRGYLRTERVTDAEILCRASESVARGEPFLDPTSSAAFFLRSAESDELAALTPPERQVLALIAQGASNRAIAATLTLTARAVERRVSSIFAKLDLHDDHLHNRRVVAALLMRSHDGLL
jgi:DNA-binding NarL/FixJ family response regulator